MFRLTVVFLAVAATALSPVNAQNNSKSFAANSSGYSGHSYARSSRPVSQSHYADSFRGAPSGTSYARNSFGGNMAGPSATTSSMQSPGTSSTTNSRQSPGTSSTTNSMQSPGTSYARSSFQAGAAGRTYARSGFQGTSYANSSASPSSANRIKLNTGGSLLQIMQKSPAPQRSVPSRPTTGR